MRNTLLHQPICFSEVSFWMRWKCPPVFHPCLPVQHHHLPQYLKDESVPLNMSGDSFWMEGLPRLHAVRTDSPVERPPQQRAPSVHLREWATLEVDPPASGDVGRTTASLTPDCNPIGNLSQDHPGSCFQFMPHRRVRDNNDHCCFKPLSLGMICYAVFDDKSTKE